MVLPGPFIMSPGSTLSLDREGGGFWLWGMFSLGGVGSDLNLGLKG